MGDVFGKETMAGLLIRLEKEVGRKSNKVLSSSLMVEQLAKDLDEVRGELRHDMGLGGKDAVKKMWEAMKGKFESDVQPIPYLYRKYGKEEMDQIIGRHY